MAASQLEQGEVDLILQSGIFDKAPRLGKFFRYICERHFEGQADRIKEYSIALEALGRPPEFDPKKDSIVRVEAHRLRKRLEDYYRGQGAGHAIQVAIPNGQYRPQFIYRPEISPEIRPEIELIPDAVVKELEVMSAAELVPVTAEASRGKRAPRWPLGVTIAAAMLAIAVTGFFAVRRHLAPGREAASEVWTGNSAEPAGAEIRIMAGYHGPPFSDRQGHTWGPDAYYSGGVSQSIASDQFIEAQPDPHFIRAQRTGQFRYDIPLRQGTYELHLYFAETEYGRGNPKGGSESTRIFQVSMNGAVRLPSFDPLAEAGSPNRLHGRLFKDVAPAADGKLHLSFESGTAAAFVNAIEILPSTPGRVHPVRIVTQANPVVDADGRAWAADEYFLGGTSVFRRNVVVNHPEKVLYEGERYGNFSYRIPLAPGKYRLTLHFAETWFGTPESNSPALDSRRFNVFANGVALLRDFDIVRETGGPNRCVSKVFNNLEPNAQGVLSLEFVPVKNYAEVNAIEIVETE